MDYVICPLHSTVWGHSRLFVVQLIGEGVNAPLLSHWLQWRGEATTPCLCAQAQRLPRKDSKYSNLENRNEAGIHSQTPNTCSLQNVEKMMKSTQGPSVHMLPNVSTSISYVCAFFVSCGCDFVINVGWNAVITQEQNQSKKRTGSCMTWVTAHRQKTWHTYTNIYRHKVAANMLQ